MIHTCNVKLFKNYHSNLGFDKVSKQLICTTSFICTSMPSWLFLLLFHATSGCCLWERFEINIVSFRSSFTLKDFFTFDLKDFRQCLFYFRQFLISPAIFNRLPPPSYFPIILYNFWSTCTAQIQCNSFAVILPMFLGKYKL